MNVNSLLIGTMRNGLTIKNSNDMKQKKDGLIVVIYDADGGGGISAWYEFSHTDYKAALVYVKFMRKKLHAYWWGEVCMFWQGRNLTLCQTSSAKPDFKVKLRNVNYNNK